MCCSHWLIIKNLFDQQPGRIGLGGTIKLGTWMNRDGIKRDTNSSPRNNMPTNQYNNMPRPVKAMAMWQ